MARHVGHVEGSLNQPIVYQGHCQCGAKGPVTGSRADADLWVDTHLLQAQRSLAHRNTRTPTLEDQAKWYRDRAGVTTGPEHEQWDQLATELEHRLGHDQHNEQPPLY